MPKSKKNATKPKPKKAVKKAASKKTAVKTKPSVAKKSESTKIKKSKPLPGKKEKLLSNDPWQAMKDEVQVAMEAAATSIKLTTKGIDVANTIEEPPTGKMGDIACSLAFQLGRKHRKNPRQVAEALIEKVKAPNGVKKVALAGAYVNFFLDRNVYAKRIVAKALEPDYGRGTPKKDRIMVEYSQPNPHKAFHIGHVRNTVLGESLSRILKYSGYEVTQVNYFNDVGAHVAKCLWNYQKNYKGKEPREGKGVWLGKLYAEVGGTVEADPTLKEEISEVQRALEAGEDQKLTALWKETRKWSVDEFKRIYKELDANFDHDFYESDLLEEAREIVTEAQKKKVAKKSKGAIIVNLEKFNQGIALILKTDGTMLYLTKDLALAAEKFKKYRIDRSVYVVGSEQRLHFQQLFKILELMKFKQAKKCFHLAYELVTLREGKMSSREGTAILYDELRDKVIEKAFEEVMAHNPEMDAHKQTLMARAIGFGAMKYDMLKVGANKTIFFDWNTALKLEGETAPYIQYATVRAKRILEKAKHVPDFRKASFSGLKTDEEFEVVKLIARFPNIVATSAEEYHPSHVANYVHKLADAFNKFYNTSPVLNEENEELSTARLALVSATYKTLQVCLDLLGIQVPDRM